MIFFTDENFIYHAAALLRAFDHGNEYRAFLDCFHKGTKDIEWLRQIGKWQERPHIICGDGRILTNAVERQALRESKCTFIYLASGWTETPWDAFAWKLIKFWPEVRSTVAKSKDPAIIELSTRGRIDRKRV